MAEELTVCDILKQWLKDHGHDGLIGPEGECGCGLDDLIPCEDAFDGCCPAYRGPDPDREGDFLMYPTRHAAQAAKDAAKKDNSDEPSPE